MGTGFDLKVGTGFDLETGSADDLYRARRGYVRLAGAVAGGTSLCWTNCDHLLEYLKAARVIYGHDIFRFDLQALALDQGDLAVYDRLSAKAIDTAILGRLLDPPSAKHMPPGYYGLDAMAHRIGHVGKTDDLKSLAAEYGGYDCIPVDDPRYTSYLFGDLAATEAVWEWSRSRLVEVSDKPGWQGVARYAQREMRVARLQSRMSLSGWRVDEQLLAERAAAEEEQRSVALQWLADHCGVPLTRQVGTGRGSARVWRDEPVKSPLATAAGKEALIEAFRAAGAAHYPRTDTGKLSTAADAMGSGRYMLKGRSRPGMLHPSAYGHNPEVRRICEAVRLVTGASAKYLEIAKYVIDGRVHSRIGEDQASGRWAMIAPSLTNMGKRGEALRQRAVLVPEPGHVLIAADLDQVDMRAVAAHSQDTSYMRLFEPGRDAHSEIALAVFGDAGMREQAKPISHGWNYGRGAVAISESTGLPLETVQHFDQQMREQFPRLCEWREEVRSRGESGRLLDNGFGRPMRCDPDRAWTQAPALMGQGTARDILCEGLLRLPEEFLPYLRGVVHDEVVLSVPERHVTEIGKVLIESLQFEWKGLGITAGLSRPGNTWADCYRKD